MSSEGGSEKRDLRALPALLEVGLFQLCSRFKKLFICLLLLLLLFLLQLVHGCAYLPVQIYNLHCVCVARSWSSK